MKQVLLILFVIISAASCDDPFGPDPEPRKLTEWEKLVQYRARQMGEINWVTMNNVPGAEGEYLAGTEVVGIPYSSVKEVGAYVGFDVSFYTFITSALNPRSVLYTEDISRPPYNGTNCTTYYGTVCSSSVCYALGIDLPYNTSSIIDVEGMERKDNISLDTYAIGDVLWREGHVFMVYDLEFDRHGTISGYDIFESRHAGTSIRHVSRNEFNLRRHKDELITYRYKGRNDNRFQDEPVYCSSEMTPMPVCPNKGDKSVYSSAEKIKINVLDDNYDSLYVSCDGLPVCSCPVTSPDIELSNLKGGIYSVCLGGGGREKSSPAHFEVISCSAVCEPAGGSYKVSFSADHGKVKYAKYVSKVGAAKETYPLTDADRSAGSISIPKCSSTTATYLRLIIEGHYGNLNGPYMEVENM